MAGPPPPKAGASRPARKSLEWARSKTVGRVSEIAVLSPIRKGCPPGERRTYEERLRALIANLAKRHEQGLPIELDRVASIHFGRMIIIRPEQYLVYSDVHGVDYYDDKPPPDAEDDAAMRPAGAEPAEPPPRINPEPIDDFHEVQDLAAAAAEPPPGPTFRSWLLTLVVFDGDLKAYMRDIADFLAKDFDSIYHHCEDFPGTQPFEPFWIWIRRYQINTDLFYATYPGLSVARLKQLETFKRRFDEFVARVRTPLGERVGSMDELFDEFLRESQQHALDFPTPGGSYLTGGRHDR